MNNINEELFKFIEVNKSEEPQKILFRYHAKSLPFSIQFAVLQLESRKKYKNKFPTFLSAQKFIFPDSLAPEQASDESVAKYHASLVGRDKNILDMTAGLGIDALSIAKNGNFVTAVEFNPDKEKVLRHNAKELGVGSFNSLCCDSVEFIRTTQDKFDIVFIDPARRKADNSRAYSFADCTPDILTIINDIYKISEKIIIKASPLLDIHNVLKEIPTTTHIHLVCVKGECKEVLIEANKTGKFRGVTVVDLIDGIPSSKISFTKDELQDTTPEMADLGMIHPGVYLYEPVSGLMKITAYGALCKRFGLFKVVNNKSLYISDKFIPDFPGRITKIESIADKRFLSSIKGEKFNVVARNYPITADSIRRKYRFKEGDECFLYAFRAGDKEAPVMISSVRVK